MDILDVPMAHVLQVHVCIKTRALPLDRFNVVMDPVYCLLRTVTEIGNVDWKMNVSIEKCYENQINA